MEVAVHIGLHKTGTTFLQDEVFPKIKNVAYAKYGGFKTNFLKDEVVLLSNESYSGIPYYAENESFLKQFRSNMVKLNDIFSQPYILIGFREPSTWFNSLYKQYLQEGGTLDFMDFFKNLKFVINYNDYFYEDIYTILLDIFPKEKIFVYFHEELKSNPSKLVNEMISFISPEEIDTKTINFNVKSNRSIPDNLESTMIFLNKIESNLNPDSSKGNFIKKILNKFKLTPRKLVQEVLPGITGRRKVRNINFIKEMHSEKWNKFKEKLLNERSNTLRKARYNSGRY